MVFCTLHCAFGLLITAAAPIFPRAHWCRSLDPLQFEPHTASFPQRRLPLFQLPPTPLCLFSLSHPSILHCPPQVTLRHLNFFLVKSSRLSVTCQIVFYALLQLSSSASKAQKPPRQYINPRWGWVPVTGFTRTSCGPCGPQAVVFGPLLSFVSTRW